MVVDDTTLGPKEQEGCGDGVWLKKKTDFLKGTGYLEDHPT